MNAVQRTVGVLLYWQETACGVWDFITCKRLEPMERSSQREVWQHMKKTKLVRSCAIRCLFCVGNTIQDDQEGFAEQQTRTTFDRVGGNGKVKRRTMTRDMPLG